MTTTINLIANIVLTLSGMVFFLQLYGRESSVVHRWNYVRHTALKVGLSFFVAGSFYSALKNNEVPFSQVLTNIGLACIFTWAVIFHYKIFKGQNGED